MNRWLIRNIFSDKSSLVFRALLREPEKRWTVSQLALEGVSAGLANLVLKEAEKLGYVHRIRRGPYSYTVLVRKGALLRDWIKAYSFSRNLQKWYFFNGEDFKKACAQYFTKKGIPYLFTLFSASCLVTGHSYVMDERNAVYVNIKPDQMAQFFKDLELSLPLLELKRGGNACFAIPFYKSSIVKNNLIINDFKITSNLQLYLDLMGFPPSGEEEVDHIKEVFQRRGENFV